MFRSIVRICACLSLAVFFAGCGGKSLAKTFPVTGVVTFQGKPLTNAIVSFMPAGGRPASGVTNERGEFTLSTFAPSDGALPGKHKVIVSEPTPEPKEGDYSVPEPTPSRFPEKYANPRLSPLEFEVKPGGENKFTIELKDG